jgi:hypothetical protein
MLADDRWHAMYAARDHLYTTGALVPRLAMWVCAAVASFAVIAAWQVGDAGAGAGRSRRVLAVLALIGIAGSTVLALVVRGMLAPPARAGADAATPWLVVLIAGRVAEAAAWIAILVGRGRRTALAVVTAGAVAALVGGAVLREAARIYALGAPSPAAVQAGGAVVFVIAVVGVTAAIAWIARLVRQAPRSPTAAVAEGKSEAGTETDSDSDSETETATRPPAEDPRPPG